MPATPEYLAYVKSLGFQVGDTVCIARNIDRGDLGTSLDHFGFDCSRLGKEAIVTRVGDNTGDLTLRPKTGDTWLMPAISCDLVKPASCSLTVGNYTVEAFHDGSLKFGCTGLSSDEVEEIIAMRKEVMS